ncbi:hypothetical protein, partial [Escherichia coli]|uniref:hypothetical protein n=1 Tax=Escherichia coli TaxID=562 RepID=UPI001BFC8C3B
MSPRPGVVEGAADLRPHHIARGIGAEGRRRQPRRQRRAQRIVCACQRAQVGAGAHFALPLEPHRRDTVFDEVFV